MKKRFSYVSNSSTSSFIMSGTKINTKNFNDDEMDNLYENFTVLNQEDFDLENDEVIVGKSLLSWDDGDGITEYSAEEFLEKLEAIKIKLLDSLKDSNLKKEEIKIYVGTKMC